MNTRELLQLIAIAGIISVLFFVAGTELSRCSMS